MASQLTGVASPSGDAPPRTPRTFLQALSLDESPGDRVLWPLFLVSFSSLYLEILLIRWIGTEIRVFAYFQNLALVACFLGFGLGCFQSARKKTGLFGLGAL